MVLGKKIPTNAGGVLYVQVLKYGGKSRIAFLQIILFKVIMSGAFLLL